MTQLLTLILWFLAQLSYQSQPCLPEGIIFNTQGQVDSFNIRFPGCDHIQGDVEIIGSKIKNLDSLYSIFSIGGSLQILYTDSLLNLNGLKKLQSIGEDLLVIGAIQLSSLSGLDSLQSIGTDLSLQQNPGLKNLSGLASLNKINGYLSVAENDSLLSLNGLGPIDPDSLNYLYINDSRSLSVCSHESICTYLANGGQREISNNALGCSTPFQVLKACFPGEDCPPGFLSFYTQLELDQFAEAYPDCQDLNGPVQIGPSPGASPIISLEGFSGVRSIAGYLDIIQNSDLQTLTGLDSLVRVGGFVSINTNNSLVDLTGLGSLSSISGQLEVYFNDLLTSLTGLGQQKIDSLTALFIEFNPLLSVCGVPVVCNFITVSDDVTIRFNASGCANLSQVNTACGIFTCLQTGIVFSSQEEIDLFPVNYPGCTRIVGDVTIAGPDIENVDSLIQLQSIFGSLNLFTNNVLTNIDGLSNLQSIFYLDIENNPLLPGLVGLSSLHSTGGILIYNNPALSSLAGLGQIDYNTISDIYIESNPNLSQCDVSSICNYLNDPLKAPNSYFAFNDAGCSNPAQIKTACGTATCPGGALILNTQAEVDSFTTTYKDCTVLPGDLMIEGEDITHLDSLRGITTINGQLIIQNTLLKSLNGLAFVSPATLTNLSIQNNDSLAVCEVRLVCDYLADASNTYTISGNAATCASYTAILTECARTCFWDGVTLASQAEVDSFSVYFSTCTHIPGFLTITGDDITHLDSLYQLETIGGGLFINQTSLTDLNGLENLKTLGSSLSIRNSILLTDISQLGGVDSIGGSLRIENTQLANLNGLSGIRYIPFAVSVLNNPVLVSLAGLSGLQNIGLSLGILGNALLPNLSGLENLKSVGTNVSIQNNNELRTLAGLSGLESVLTVLRIENNPALDSLVGLNSLKSIGSELFVRNNAVLKNIHSLNALTSIRRLTISNNPVMTSLKGLEKINPVMLTNLVLQNSGNLAVCNMGSICTYLSIMPAKSFTISGNAITCSSKDQILASCASFFPVSLVTFQGTVEQRRSILKWQTASEQELDYYNVEHSRDGILFLSIGTQSVVGNSIQLKNYHMVHYSPPAGINYYRLKMVDHNGGFYYSDVISLQTFENITVYPNPTQNKIYLHGLEGGSTRVVIKDMIGRLLFEASMAEGQAIDMSRQHSGVYLLFVDSGNQSIVLRIIRE